MASYINKMKMNIEEQIKLNIITCICETICLMDGRVILGEGIGYVNLLTADGKFIKKLPIPDEAWSTTQINQDTIALTFPQKKVIKFFNMENEKVTKVIPFDKPCNGLSFSNNSLAVGLGKDEICIIDLDGNTLKTIEIVSTSGPEYLVYRDDRVIFSDFEGKTVSCFDESGQQIWTFDQDLEGPAGLCIDTYGNAIVVDYYARRIIVISKDGQESKVLVSEEEDGLKELRCVCLKNNESKGYICLNNSATNLAKFSLSYE